MILKKNFSLFLVAVMGLLFASCEGDDSTDLNATTEQPVITNVTTVDTGETITSGFRRSFYVIKGEHLGTTTEVLFNGEPAFVNTAFVTDTSVVISIPAEASFDAEVSQIELKTINGSTTLPFGVNPPRPEIAAFYPIGAVAGEELTIEGDFFNSIVAARIGEAEAEVLSVETTKMVVKVPQNAVPGDKIFIESTGGIGQSDSPFGMSELVYGDAIRDGWEFQPWGDHEEFPASTEQVRGDGFSIKRVNLAAWTGFRMLTNGNGFEAADLEMIRFSLYCETEEVKLLAQVSGGAEIVVAETLVTGEWVDYAIPLADFGITSGSINAIIMKTDAASVIHFDDIGFL